MAKETTTFPITGVIDLTIRLGHGAITVHAKEELTEASVRLIARNGQDPLLERMTVEMQGPTLYISGPRTGGLSDIWAGWRRDRDAVDVVVEVPAGTAMKISSASEDIIVTGRCGDADVATGHARITLDTVGGNLRLRYGKADSRVNMVTGSVQISAGSGTAHFGEVNGQLECKFGRGELVADVVRGQVHSRAGFASANIGAVYGDVDMAFGSGPIRIGLPGGVAARVDVASGTGWVHSDFPVEQTTPSTGKPISIRARTGNGDVRLVRAAAA